MQLLLVVVCAIAVAAIAHRKGLDPSIVVVVLASLVSFIPGLPRFELQPDLILGVVIPPLLYSAALDFSFGSFARNIRPILALGVGMVLVSTFATGLVAWWLVPSLAFTPALVLGSVVAPPDAVAALAVGRRLGLPKRLMAILTGESLVNDASALTVFSLTVAAVTGGHTTFSNPFLLFGYDAAGGVVIGLLLGIVVHWIRLRLRDSGFETALGLAVPFAAYLLAEQIHASGVLAVVMAGFSLGHNNASVGFETRLQDRQVWQSLDTLLETFVFAYMGLRCRFIFDEINPNGLSWPSFVVGAAVVLLTVLLIRPAWVFLAYGRDKAIHAFLLRVLGEQRVAARTERRRERVRRRNPSGPPPASQLSWRYLTVISWSGMRGVVTLAAAAGIPSSFPHRDIIQALAFVVAVGTLLIQGPTLPPLIRALNISAPEERRYEAESVRIARQIIQSATEKTVREIFADPPAGVDRELLIKYEQRFKLMLAARKSSSEDESDQQTIAERADSPMRDATKTVRRTMLAAQRAALTDARDKGELDDDVTRRELERLDYEEAAAWWSSSLDE